MLELPVRNWRLDSSGCQTCIQLYVFGPRNLRKISTGLIMMSSTLMCLRYTCFLPLQELIYQEFFKQGDLEKSLGRSPLVMMDREKACIPELQIGFLEGIVLPLYTYVLISFVFEGFVL